MDRSDRYFDPMRQCEHEGGCREPFGLRLVLRVRAGRRSYHWLCARHR